MVSVYDYIDYRRFLNDRFSEMKKERPSLSYRVFNRQAGIKSSGFLKLVVDRKRNLAEAGIRMIAKGFRLSDAEERYFELLVKFNQATNNEEKDRLFRLLSQNKRFLQAKPLTAAQYRLFSHWYYVAILESTRIDTRQAQTIQWLQRVVHPPVSIKHIKKAVADLKKMELLEEIKGGVLRRMENMITTGDEVSSIAVANFHVQMCQMAARAVMQEDAKNREFSALTIVTSEASFQKAKQEIQKFRKKLHSILEQESDGLKQFVAHLNFHLFKLNRQDEST